MIRRNSGAGNRRFVECRGGIGRNTDFHRRHPAHTYALFADKRTRVLVGGPQPGP